MNKSKAVFHYNLKSSTQQDFDSLLTRNQKLKGDSRKSAFHPMRRGLGQLTPSNVLTVRGYWDSKGSKLVGLRSSLYRFAKLMNLSIETAFDKNRGVLLVRLKRNWPVAVVDISRV